MAYRSWKKSESLYESNAFNQEVWLTRIPRRHDQGGALKTKYKVS